MAEFRIWSDEFKENGFLQKAHELDLAAFGGAGQNLSPALHWASPPADAQSLALSVYDPDAPTGSGFWHWVVVNLPVSSGGLESNAGCADGSRLPSGAQQFLNDYGTSGFGGAAPPRGDPPHRYLFRIHALKVAKLDLPSNATNAVARFMIHLNEIDSATYTGLYELK